MPDEMRLAGICKDCMKRLGVDERLTIPLKFVNVSNLSAYDSKALSNVQFSTGRGVPQGTTKITYKVAKTVKESIDDAQSHPQHPEQ
jgi:hypothetical protein